MRISDWSSDVCSSDLVLRRPPVGQRAGLVIFRTLIVEMMAQFMTNDRADATIVDHRIGIGIEERRLQDCGWKHDLDHAAIGIGLNLPPRPAPFPSVNGLTQLPNFLIVLKLARPQRISA